MGKHNKNSGILFDLINPAITDGLSVFAELLLRRISDKLWIAPGARIPASVHRCKMAFGRGLKDREFFDAWKELQAPGLEVLRLSDDGKWYDLEAITQARQKADSISKARSVAGRMGGLKKARPKGLGLPAAPRQRRPPGKPVKTGSATNESGPARKPFDIFRQTGKIKPGFFDDLRRQQGEENQTTGQPSED